MSYSIEGPGSVNRIAEVMSPFRDPIALVTGSRAFVECGAQEAILPALSKRHLIRVDGVTPNPSLSELTRLIDQVMTAGPPGVVLAVGGGSVLDMAKLLAAACMQDFPPSGLVTTGLEAPAIPIVAVPTTAGSGSERTHFAVLYVADAKHSVAHPSMRPRSVVLDSRLTESMSPTLTAISGMDALSHAIESMWSIRSTEESRAMSAEAATNIWQQLPAAVHHPTPEVRRAMLKAAGRAGEAIDIAHSTAPHAISYHLTKLHGVPHGHAVAVMLGEVFLFNAGVTGAEVVDPRGASHVESVIDTIVRLLGCNDAVEASRAIDVFVSDLGLSTSLGSLGVTSPEARRALVQAVNQERLANNPRRLAESDLMALVEARA